MRCLGAWPAPRGKPREPTDPQDLLVFPHTVSHIVWYEYASSGTLGPLAILRMENSTTPPKDPITCHVLDLVTGRPAPNLAVSLSLTLPLTPSATFRSMTNADGRITNWQGQDESSLESVVNALSVNWEGKTVWALKFETGTYFGDEHTFFPQVEVQFFMSPTEGHYHVPLLLGPWSYTTYRGS